MGVVTLDVNNPYKRIGGGSLDQALFHTGRHQPKVTTPSPTESETRIEDATDSSSPEKAVVTTKIEASHPSNSSPIVRPNAATPVRPNGKRIITRNSFEIYEDQMDSLRRVSYEEKIEGKLGSMSNMVREAIDDYLQKRTPRH